MDSALIYFPMQQKSAKKSGVNLMCAYSPCLRVSICVYERKQDDDEDEMTRERK